MEVSAEKIIDALALQIAQLTKELAVARETIRVLQQKKGVEEKDVK